MYHFKHIEPSSKLKPFIVGYWLMERSKDCPVATRLTLVPDGHPEFVFHLNEPFWFLSEYDPPTQHARTGIIGQLTKAMEMKALPGAKAFFVKLYPWVPYWLFKTPLYLFNNQSVELENLDKTENIKSLAKNIRSASSVNEMIAHFESYFIKKVKSHSTNPLLELAIKKIFQKKGNLTMDELNLNVKVSHRYLEMLFKKELGLSPKRYARIIRIKKISLQLIEQPNTQLSQLAYQWNYYDQSHFIKDFKSISLQTPRQFLEYSQNFPIKEQAVYINQWDY